MRYILYIVAIVMIIVWAIGFFVYSFGAIIHLLLVIALISIMVKVFSGNKSI
ncbi:lmo0937 family membrane protein [Marivirga sp.]|uniref:lmo0937 family membrane protein n=1 Tax=Marivirga sp. TaxID=2018662 RepID=UPI002D8028C9|nr:lmo0937 family membrane protein [Marivirga sp.]HET8860058.1 lmo0937 family membrane protein [Marivirga sp.]